MKTITLALLVTISGLTTAQPIKSSVTVATNQLMITKQTTPKTMKNQTTQLVYDFLTAVQQGNHALVTASLDEAVEWDQPGTNYFSGVKKSRQEVFQMVGGMYELTANTMKLTDIKVLAENGNEVACLLHWKAARPTGEVLDVDNIDVYTVEKGHIVKARIFSADLTQENKFWAR